MHYHMSLNMLIKGRNLTSVKSWDCREISSAEGLSETPFSSSSLTLTESSVSGPGGSPAGAIGAGGSASGSGSEYLEAYRRIRSSSAGGLEDQRGLLSQSGTRFLTIQESRIDQTRVYGKCNPQKQAKIFESIFSRFHDPLKLLLLLLLRSSSRTEGGGSRSVKGKKILYGKLTISLQTTNKKLPCQDWTIMSSWLMGEKGRTTTVYVLPEKARNCVQLLQIN